MLSLFGALNRKLVAYSIVYCWRANTAILRSNFIISLSKKINGSARKLVLKPRLKHKSLNSSVASRGETDPFSFEMADDFEIREGTASDAKALSVLAAETFCDTFAHLYTPNDLHTFLSGNYSEQIQLGELERPDFKTLLLVCKENIVGFCMLRFGSREAQIEGPDPVAEIWRFYISKSYIGAGVARILMDRVMEVLQECKTSVEWLGVWENNQRAQKFYKKYGFQAVGYHDFVIGTAVDRDLLFQLNLYEPK